MNRRTLILLIALILSVVFATWEWYRPYEWGADPGARFRIDYTTVKRDHDFVWVDVTLKHVGDSDHDIMKPVLLVTASGHEYPPASTTLEGDPALGTTGLFFRFWLEKDEVSGPLKLKLNDGTLTVRSGSGIPEDGDSRSYHTARW